MIALAVRSHFSLGWGTASPGRLCRAARRLGYTGLALTDTDNLCGLWPFLAACRENGIRPIVGAEITDPHHPDRAVCLVARREGFPNLCRLLTRRHCDPAFSLAGTLPEFADGLTVLTASAALCREWHPTGLDVWAVAFRRPAEASLRLKQLADRLRIPMITAAGAFFLDAGDFSRHRMLRAIARNGTLSGHTAADMAPPDAWLAPPEAYENRFAVWPETLRAAAALAERLTFTGPVRSLVLPPWGDAAGPSATRTLRTEAYAGARYRYGAQLPGTVTDRLEHELAVIDRMGFSSYFLVVRDIVRESPRTCGRGSGAASLVAYCLGITNVCPIRHNLYFERFLNPGRTDPPDIDVDFAWDERDDVQAKVLTRFSGHAAMVSNHVAFQPRMAIREVAKVHGLTDREIGQVTKRLPWFWHAEAGGEDLLAHLRTLPMLKGVDFPEPWPEIVATAQQLIGVPRYLSVHPGGMVITPMPIDTYVPVEIAPKGVPIIQWEKEGAEAAGLVKIDLLGNRSLGVIRDAVATLKKNGTVFDDARWNPEADPATRATIAAGRTLGCFYIESPATRLLQQKARMGDFEHLVIHSSIIRPAANEFIREYVRRLHGGAWAPIHPLLEEVLRETYGILVYQEDVSKAAVALAGFSPVEADGLRKVMSKKDKDRRIEDYYRRFAAGARARGIDDAVIGAVWKMMMSFSGYSFCKPHSASYARVSFQAAYLKTHHPAEFMAAVIGNQGGFYHPSAYVSEARRMGVAVLPPEVNTSAIRWLATPGAMRVGWIGLKHLRAETGERILRFRRQRPYRSLTDFLDRVAPEDPEVRALIHAGAFDALHPGVDRTELLWELAAWQKSRSRRPPGPDLFGPESPSARRPAFPPEDIRRRLRREFAVLGFLCDRHPMTLFADTVRRVGAVFARDLSRHAGRRVCVAGLLVTGKPVRTKHDDPMAFFTFEDETDLIETTFFPNAYRRFCAIVDRSRPFVLRGTVDEDFGACTLRVDAVRPMEKLA